MGKTKDFAIKSIKIHNNPKYKYMLHCNDIDGYVRLTYNKTKCNIMRVTNRTIPITQEQKESFCTHAVFYEKGNPQNIPFGSYIFRDSNPQDYEQIKNWILHMYKDVFKKLEVQVPVQLSFFDQPQPGDENGN